MATAAPTNTSQPASPVVGSSEIPNAEPLPDWEEAKSVFAWAWGLHWIAFVVLFIAISAFSLARLIATRKIRRQKVSRNVSYAVHSLIIVLGLTRALALGFFPYEMTTNVKHADTEIPLYVHRLLFGLGFPCFTAAFALIQITFTESVKVTPLTHSRLRKVRFLILVIVGHFSVVIVGSIVTALVSHMAALYVVCSIYLLSMTAFTAIRITYGGFKVVHESSHSNQVIESFHNKNNAYKTRNHSKRAWFSSKAVRKVFIVTFLTLLLCIALFILEIFDLAKIVRLIREGNVEVEPWPWYIVETLFRLTEVGLACTALYAVSPYKQTQKRTLIFMCCCNKEEIETKEISSGTTKMTNLSLPLSK